MSVIQYLEDDQNRKAQPLSSDLFSELQEDILTGKLKDGSKLTESRICSQYGVSRTPVREALRQLEADGLIETIPNRGAFVTGLSPQDIRDINVMQKSAEIQAVQWAIQRITKEEMEELNETFEFMEFYTMKNDIPKMLNINMAFHQIIYHATHSRMLIQQLSTYQLYLQYCDPSNYYAPNYLSDVLGEHRSIYGAFLKHDPEEGAEAMERHMRNSERRKFK